MEDIVAGLVFSNFVEIHALAFEDTVIMPGQRFGYESVGPNLDLSNLFENLSGNHAKPAQGSVAGTNYGTGSSSRIF